MRMSLLVLVLAGCSNQLKGSGQCPIPAATGEPVVTNVPLFGQRAYFDDLHYAPALGKVLAAPEGVARMYLVDPDTLATTTIGTSGGTASADADAHTIFTVDRSNNRVDAYDAATGDKVASLPLDANPDYLRVVPGIGELWVTLPGADRIDVIAVTGSPPTLARVDSISIPGAPEGLTFGDGRGYTQAGGRVIAIDIARKLVVDESDTGCDASHGFAQVDDTYGLVFAGCKSSGGAAVLSRDGNELTGFEAGGGDAVLAYDSTRHHFYLRGDPGTTLAMVAVCRDGGMSAMAEVPIPNEGHASTIDGRGNVWIADATTGGLVRISDPFASTE
jgi:hypothetical protein